MIRDSTVFYKLISIYSLKDIDLFNRAILEFNPHHCTCPLCGAKHACISTGDAYERYLISYENQQVVVRTLSISMILCTSCKKSQPLTLPSGKSICYNSKTFAKWKNLYASGGMDALMPTGRSNYGKPRCLDESVIEEIYRLKKDFPRINATLIYHRCFAKDLNPNLYQVVYTCLSTVSILEFYRQFSNALGLESVSRKSQMFKNIQEHLIHLIKDKRKTVIFAVDESQYL